MRNFKELVEEYDSLKKENEQLKQELGNYKLLNAVFGEDKNEAVAREKLIKNQKIVMDGFAKQLCEEQQTVKQLKQQLAEKEELLKNVNNDFKIGDTVYVIRKLKQDIRCGRIEYIWDGNHKNNWRRYRVNLPKVNSVTKLKHELFATKAEAQKKLENQYQILEDNQEYNFSQDRNNLTIEKLEELLKWVDKESDGNQKYPASILIDKINSMIESLKGEK